MPQRGRSRAAVRQKTAAVRQDRAAARQERPLRHPDRLLYEDLLRRALLEDLGGAGDLTTDAIVDEDGAGAGELRRPPSRAHRRPPRGARHPPPARCRARRARSRTATAPTSKRARCSPAISGSARAILTGERVALNLLGRLSGIATATRDLTRAIEPHRARIADTRKTTPGLRVLEKYAVRVGGGANHRFGLDDAILIKDNHVAFAGGVRARRSSGRAPRRATPSRSRSRSTRWRSSRRR